MVLACAGGYTRLVVLTPPEMWSLKPSPTIIDPHAACGTIGRMKTLSCRSYSITTDHRAKIAYTATTPEGL
jgi:hypothetical protein